MQLPLSPGVVLRCEQECIQIKRSKKEKRPTSVTAKSLGNQHPTKQRQDLDIETELEAINRKLSDLVSVKEKVDVLLSVKDMVASIQHSIQVLSDK